MEKQAEGESVRRHSIVLPTHIRSVEILGMPPLLLQWQHHDIPPPTSVVGSGGVTAAFGRVTFQRSRGSRCHGVSAK